mmetsp:Transcript_52025/g.111344  ORF Transcript_52025/g.111344 Transcript_52025/m.111344 type:complete len:266 (-) Transcript_52025:42-839(-)
MAFVMAFAKLYIIASLTAAPVLASPVSQAGEPSCEEASCSASSVARTPRNGLSLLQVSQPSKSAHHQPAEAQAHHGKLSTRHAPAKVPASPESAAVQSSAKAEAASTETTESVSSETEATASSETEAAATPTEPAAAATSTEIAAADTSTEATAEEVSPDTVARIAPFGKEDTAQELQNHAAKTQDTLVDAVENAEVAEIKRSVFRALTRLRAAEIKEFDTIARLETQAIDEYNDAHHYRTENPLQYIHSGESQVVEDKYTSFHD